MNALTRITLALSMLLLTAQVRALDIKLVHHVNAGTEGLFPEQLTAGRDRLWYVVTNRGSSPFTAQLWCTQGMPSTTILLGTFEEGGDPAVMRLIPFEDKLYFFVTTPLGTPNESELWKSDGTVSGTELVYGFSEDLPWNNLGSYYRPATDSRRPIIFDGQLFFFGRDSTYDPLLWRSGGTTSTTSGVPPETGSLKANSGFVILDNELYFSSEGTPSQLLHYDSVNDEFDSIHTVESVMHFPVATDSRIVWTRAQMPTLPTGRRVVI